MNYQFVHLSKVLFVTLFMVFYGKNLTSVLLNNLGSIILLEEWPLVAQDVSLPHCHSRLDKSAATSLITESLMLDFRNQRAWLNAGRTAWLQGQCVEAFDSWRRAALMSSDDVIARLEKGHALYASGAMDIAIEQYRDLDVAGYFYLKAKSIVQRDGNSSETIKWYELSMNVSPSLLAVDRIATYYLELGQHHKALEAWEELLDAKDVGDSDYWWALGNIAKLNNDPVGEMFAYQQGGRLAKDPFDFFRMAGLAAERSGMSVEAKQYYELAISLRQDGSCDLYIRIGDLEVGKEDYDSALNWYQDAARKCPESNLLEYHKGLVFFKMKKFVQARENFLEAKMKNPKNSLASYYLGVIAYQTGDVSQAILYLEDAIALNTGKPWAWVRDLGTWYLEADRCEESVLAFEKALTWKPDEKILLQRLEESKALCR